MPVVKYEPPGDACTLGLMPNIDLSMIYLIRDSRTTAYSWTKRQKKGLGPITWEIMRWLRVC